MTFAKLDLPQGHLGKHAIQGTGPFHRRDVKTEPVTLPDGATVIEYIRPEGVSLEALADGAGTEQNPVAMDVLRLDVHEVQTRTGGFRLFYCWNPVDQVLLYDPARGAPPEWLLEGLWGRHVAMDEGLIDSMDDAPLCAPEPTDPPKLTDLSAGAALDRMGTAVNLERQGDSDAVFRARINEQGPVRAPRERRHVQEFSADIQINPDGSVPTFDGLAKVLGPTATPEGLKASFSDALKKVQGG